VDGGEVDHPQRIRARDLELAIDLVERAQRLWVADGRYRLLPASYPSQPHRPHQPFDSAFGDIYSLAPQLVPNLPGAVEAKAGIMDAPDLIHHLVIAPGTR